MQYGKPVAGRYEPVVISTLSITKPGEIYEFHIETDKPIEDEEAVINQLLTVEGKVQDLKIISIETLENNKIILQFTDIGPGDINVWGLWEVMGPLLAILGITAALIVVFQIWTTQPWLIAILAGCAVILFIYGETKRFVEGIPARGPRPSVFVKFEKETEKEAVLAGRKLTIEMQLKSLKSSKNIADKNRTSISVALASAKNTFEKKEKDWHQLKDTLKKTKGIENVSELKKEIDRVEKEKNEAETDKNDYELQLKETLSKQRALTSEIEAKEDELKEYS